LLAYLDDTLEPSEIKAIGQKVAESETAQELIARIKQITRRRRLTTPPATGPNSFDPNTVSEYLDNELTAEKMAELEKLCLESDVHLAEIASCHQILTLVLGEPAVVPPTAKERMYGLVHGREAIPFRKASAPAGALAGAAGHHDPDADETLLLGLPFYRRGSWLRWALPAAAILLLGALGVALWQALGGSGTPDTGKVASAGPSTSEKKDQPRDTGKDSKPGNGGDNDPAKRGDKDEKDGKGKKANGDTTDVPKPREPEPKPGPRGKTEADRKGPDSANRTPSRTIAPPSDERALLGKSYRKTSDLPSILVAHAAGKDWKWVRPFEQIYSNDHLVSLPGSRSEVRLDSEVHLVLRGLMPEFSRGPVMDFLMESAVVLHKPETEFDLDLTLERGRIYLSNHKPGPAKVRLRFGPAAEPEVWDLTLAEGNSEVGIDFSKRCTQEIKYLEGEEPDMILVLQVLSGKAGLKVEANTYPNLTPSQRALFVWDYKSGKVAGPLDIEEKLPNWTEAPPSTPPAPDLQLAVKELSGQMDAKKSPVLVAEEFLDRERPADHVLAIYCLGAMDQVPRLLNVLGEQDPSKSLDRERIIFTLRCWLGHNGEQSRSLYDPRKKTGLLMNIQKYRPNECQTLAELLHDFSDEDKRAPATYETLSRNLLSDKVAIAELAFYHLRRMARGVKLPPFNAAAPRDRRQDVVDEVESLLKAGKLPPPEGGPSGGPPPLPKKP
jgi:hypothetical protein